MHPHMHTPLAKILQKHKNEQNIRMGTTPIHLVLSGKSSPCYLKEDHLRVLTELWLSKAREDALLLGDKRWK